MPVEVMDELPGETPKGEPKAKAKGKPKVGSDTMAQDKPSVHYEGDTLVIRASALGNCLGNLFRSGHGETPMPPPDWMQEKFDQGHEAEPIILDWVRGRSWGVFDDFELEERFGELHNGQARIEIPCGSGLVVRQHFDGFAREGGTGREFCLEAKAWTAGTLKSFEAKVEFVKAGEGENTYESSVIVPSSMRSSYIGYQISCAILGSKMPVLLVVGVKTEESKGKPPEEVEIEDFFTYVVEEPPFSRGEVMSRAMRVREVLNEGKPPPCDIRQFPCGYWQEHDETEGVWAKGVAVDIATIDVEEALFDSLASEYHAAHLQEKQWKERKSAAKKGLDAAFEGTTEPIESKLVRVKKTVQTKKGAVDWEAAAKDAGVDTSDSKVQEKYRKPSYTSEWYTVELKDDDD